MNNVRELAQRIHENAVNKGFWNGEAALVSTKFALIHSEISEALEEHRCGNGLSAVAEEIADVAIRILDLMQGTFTSLPSRVGEEEGLKTLGEDTLTFAHAIAKMHAFASEAFYWWEWYNDGHMNDDAWEDFTLSMHQLLECTFDMGHYLEIDLPTWIYDKVEKNESRAHLHGKLY